MKSTHEIQNRILYIIRHYGYSMAEFARMIEQSYDSLYRMLRGDGKPTDLLLSKVMQHCPAVSSRWLFLGFGPMLRDMPEPSEEESKEELYRQADQLLQEAHSEQNQDAQLELAHEMTIIAAMLRDEIETLKNDKISLQQQLIDLQKELNICYKARFGKKGE